MSVLGRLLERPTEERVGLVSLYESWKDGTEGGEHNFRNYVAEGYKSNGVVFGCILARMLMLSEAEFAFQNRRTRELFSTGRYSEALGILDKPWPNGSTGELIARAEQDVSITGNFFVHRVPNGAQLQRLRPDWTDIVTDKREVLGYIHHEGGRIDGNPVFLPKDEVAHWSPIPDPEAPFRGMSWLTPVAIEVDADKAMTRHKKKFFDHAATPNLLLKVDRQLPQEVRERVQEQVSRRHEGWENAYRTMLLEGGVDAQVVGNSFEQMTFNTVQAAGENRICIAAGVPGIIIGAKEGLDAATYSNYQQAMRRFVDLTCRPLWRSLAGALSSLIRIPPGARLWYDDANIPALKEDGQARADIKHKKALTIQLLINSGYEPGSVAKVVENDEPLDNLTHTGGIPTTLFPGGNPSPNGAPEDQASQGANK